MYIEFESGHLYYNIYMYNEIIFELAIFFLYNMLIYQCYHYIIKLLFATFLHKLYQIHNLVLTSQLYFNKSNYFDQMY